MKGLIFLGTPSLAVPSLEVVHGTGDLRLVITRPDRPRGRRGTPQPPPIKQRALELDVAVSQPATRRELIEAVGNAGDIEVGVVVAYGRIIPPEAFTHPRQGMVNVHFSLLPRWRGAAPVERAILAGDTITGVSLMEIAEGLDTGGVYARWKTSIGEDETAGELTERLAQAGAELLAAHLPELRAGSIPAEPQDDSLATHAPRITTEEAHLDFHLPASELARRIRAFNPRPGAFAFLDGERFKIWRAAPDRARLEPGQMAVIDHRLLVGTGDGALWLTEVQAAGSRRMEAMAWARGRRDGPDHLT